jgi:glycosyltransferase involved in cell wall biosynthesis
MPAVSVVIPLYQTERYIASSLGSVLAQTFGDFEVLVIDDGSSDRGPEIARSTGDPRVRVVTQANRGLAGARNTGIREAVAPYIAFLDADDLWAPTKLAQHMTLLESAPDIGLTFSASALIDDDGRSIGLTQRPKNEPFTAEHVFCRNPVGNGSAPVLRRAALDDIAFHCESLGRICWFDESFRQSEDIECWTRIVVTGKWRLALVDEPLTLYRVSSGGLSANVDRQLATWRRFRAKVRTYAPDLEARVGDLAEAYQLRYLARRAVRSADGSTALRLIAEALRLDASILWREPSRTGVTVLAALARRMLPGALFGAIERAAINASAQRASLRF